MPSDRFSQYVDEDGIFTAPNYVGDLYDIPKEYHPMYRRGDRAGWTLTPDGRELKAEMEAEVARIRSEHETKKQQMRDEIDKLQSERRNTAIDRALNDALGAAGVKRTLRRAAGASIREALRFEVEDSDDGDGQTVLVHSNFGLHSVDDAVAAFLDSDDGDPFRPTGSTIPAEGSFSALVETLRKRS